MILIVVRSKAKGKSIQKVFKPLLSNVSKINTIDVLELPFNESSFTGLVRNIILVLRHASRYDLVHITGDCHYLGTFMSKKKVMHTVHDLVLLSQERKLKRLVLELFWYTIPFKRSAKIIAISNSTSESLQYHYNVKPEVIYNPLIVEKYQDDVIRTKSVLQVGTGWNKGLDFVVNALRNSDYLLKILGPLTYEQRRELDKSGINYEHYENVSERELAYLYRSSMFLSFLSSFEGFGLPIIEAQNYGTLVIASDLEVCQEVGGSGAIYISRDSGELRLRLDQLYNNPGLRKSVLSKGRENSYRFSESRFIESYMARYKNYL